LQHEQLTTCINLRVKKQEVKTGECNDSVRSDKSLCSTK